MLNIGMIESSHDIYLIDMDTTRRDRFIAYNIASLDCIPFPLVITCIDLSERSCTNCFDVCQFNLTVSFHRCFQDEFLLKMLCK
jgi:hypothetical protein